MTIVPARYEAAIETLGIHIAGLNEALQDEQARPEPDDAMLARLREQRGLLADWQDALHPTDAEEIAVIDAGRSTDDLVAWIRGRIAVGPALLRAIEGDLAHYHVTRMAQRQVGQSLQLKAEREKPNPDPSTIAALEAAMVQTERDKRDLSITELEVLAPMRRRLAR